MGARRITAFALTGTLAAGGAGVAIAAAAKEDDRKAEQAVLADAAKRLDVSPEKLRDALAAAQDAGLDRAVKDGLLTRAQADAIKARRKASGHVLGGPPGGPKFRGGPHFGGPHPGGPGPRHGAPGFGPRHGLFGDLAAALGTTRAKLAEGLRSGKSIAEIAKGEGRSLADVGTALKSSARTRLDKAVKAGDLTRAQADRFLAHVDRQIAAITSGKRLMPRRHRHLRGALPPAPRLRSGGVMPGEGAPELAPRPDFTG